MRQALAWIFAPALEHRRELLAVNIAYFGVVVLGMLVILVSPEIQTSLLQSVGEAFSPTGSLGPLVQAYETGDLPTAITLTFLVNLILGAGVFITLPSVAIPYAGLIMGAYRALLWGLIFSPFAGVFPLATLPHVLTALIEGEAYIVAMLGVALWWNRVVRAPGARWEAWVSGLKYQGRIYALVAFLLAVAAIYEVLEVVLLLPRLM